METTELEDEVVLVEIPNQTSQIDSLINRLRNHETHLSYSSLKAFRDSPTDFIQYKFRKKKTTDAMLFGSLVHCLILEPQEFENRYAVMDDLDICSQIGGAKPRGTNAYKEWKAVFMAEIGDKIIIPIDAYNIAKSISIGVRKNRASARILNQLTEKEKAIRWFYKNFLFLGFIDGEAPKLICDIKTCKDANPKVFQRDIIKMWYHGQAAMYLTALERNIPYYIIAVDKKGGISVHRLHKHLIEHGLQEYSDLLDSFNRCILMDGFEESYEFYSDYHDGVFIMDKPAYMY